MLGGETLKITYASRPPTVVLMAGLQGSGKTTERRQARPLVQGPGPQPAAGRRRPPASRRRRAAAHAAGARSTCRCSPSPAIPSPRRREGLAEARRLGRDVLIVDTAGRLAIDEEMMEQVRRISEAVTPDYTFLVVDAMTGQDAVDIAGRLPPTRSPSTA